MSRLIDVDKLIEVIRDLPTNLLVFHQMEEGEFTTEEIKEYFIYIIGKQPIAYDVDKVVKQLEKECVKHRINVAETNFCPPPRIINEYDYGISEGIMRAIEIVKRGGATDETRRNY